LFERSKQRAFGLIFGLGVDLITAQYLMEFLLKQKEEQQRQQQEKMEEPVKMEETRTDTLGDGIYG
jgi:hypothetical protein